MAAGRLDILVEQGADFDYPLLYSDANGVAIDLTGYTARMKVKKSLDAVGVEVDLTTENGGIVIDGFLGEVRLKMTALETAGLVIDLSVQNLRVPLVEHWLYDLELIDVSGVVTRLVEGVFSVSGGVTD